MMRLASLKARLFFGFVPLLTGMVGVVAVISHWQMEEVLYGHVDHILQAKAQGLQAIVDAVPDRAERRHRIDAVFGDRVKAAQTLYAIRDSHTGRLILSNASSGDILEAPEARTPSALATPFSRDIQNREYRLISQSHAAGATTFRILVAYPIQSLHDQLHRFLWFLLGLGAAVIAGAVALAWGAVHWALAPVNRAADLLQGISWSAASAVDMQGLEVPAELAAFKTALGDMLGRLDQFVDRQKQFTANAAHELRTPIALAKSTIQTALYRLRGTDDPQRAILDSLGDLDRMTNLIDQLQMLSCLDETESVPDPESIGLHALLQEIVQSYDYSAPGRIHAQDLPPLTVSGNRYLLTCLFTNLLDNALKHGPAAGSISLRVRSGPELDTVCIEVHDEGGAIQPEELVRLTERFYRRDASRSRHTGGSGLGLSIAHEIAKQHGGRLTISSHPQHGTCVTVQLPIVS